MPRPTFSSNLTDTNARLQMRHEIRRARRMNGYRSCRLRAEWSRKHIYANGLAFLELLLLNASRDSAFTRGRINFR